MLSCFSAEFVRKTPASTRPTQKPPRIPLPKGWPSHVQSGLLPIIALAHCALTRARGGAAQRVRARVRIAAEQDRLQQEIALLREELRSQDARLSGVAPHRRSRYAPTERRAILAVRAAHGWSLQPTADLFLLAPATVALWAQRGDEQGPPALWQLRPPVNRFPAFVRYAVQRLKTLCPTRGQVKIAQLLARASLPLSPTTVGRRLREPTPLVPKQPEGSTAGVVTAQCPKQLWHRDRTIVPTVSGFGTPGVPCALPPGGPFGGWVAVASDPYSRRLMSLAVFPQKPDSRTVGRLLESVLRSVDARPKDLVCDKNKVFWCKTCQDGWRGNQVKPRSGAVGEPGSLAVVERALRTRKNECTGRILVPQRQGEFHRERMSLLAW